MARRDRSAKSCERVPRLTSRGLPASSTGRRRWRGSSRPSAIRESLVVAVRAERAALAGVA
eukprot:10166898-Alexandrium_andersonii.AAC.1